jgi:hypothetical protein
VFCKVIPDEGVDLDGIDIIELLQRFLDLSLVGLDINDEDEGVVLLNLLHGALSVERVDDNFVLIETRLRRNGLSEVLGVAGELESLRLVEGCRGADLADLLGVDLDANQNEVLETRYSKLTPFNADFAAALACFPALPLVAAPINTYASASALDELAIICCCWCANFVLIQWMEASKCTRL